MNQLISKRFEYDRKSEVFLSRKQREALSEVLTKLKQGAYQLLDRPCSLCHQHDFEIIAKKDRFGLPVTTVICRCCGFVQTNPVMREQDYVDFYTNHYRNLYNGSPAASRSYFAIQEARGKRLFATLETHHLLPQNGLVIEVGCGAGGILRPFHQAGIKVIGLDFNEEYLNYGRNLGMEMRATTIHEFNPDRKADLIIYSHVLEHIFDLPQELKRVESLLADDGMVFVEVPGLLSYGNERSGNFLLHLQNAHLYHFTLESLTALMAKYGFKRVLGDQFITAFFKKGIAADIIENTYERTMAHLKNIESRYSRIPPKLQTVAIKSTLSILSTLNLMKPARSVRAWVKNHLV